MDLVTRRFDFTEPFRSSSSRCSYFSRSSGETSSDYSDLRSPDYSPRYLDDENLQILKSKAVNIADLDSGLIKSIAKDNKSRFTSHTSKLLKSDSKPDRILALKLLRLCCAVDAVECAAVLLNGDLGVVPVINDVEPTSGMTALHTAAEAHSARCVELLLKRRARTDLRTKDGRALLALELSLSSSRLDVLWNPDEYSVEDLAVMLSDKDLTTVKRLSEMTKELDAVAYASAIRGKIAAFAALLIVGADTVNKVVFVVHDADSGSKEKATIYECVIREALSLGRDTDTSPPSRTAKRTAPTESESAERRKLLLRQIELLHLFGAVALSGSTEKKSAPPLILAIKARDETVIELLLKRNVNIDDVDYAEGSSALHWCLRTSWGSSSKQIKILTVLLSHGARPSQKNKLESTAFHLAAAKGNLQALQILLLEDPEGINYKTVMKETPLFFAVKNDRKDCAELLLRWGANSEVLNLRKQRPIDLAKSQDMRFMLNTANISQKNLPSPEQRFSPSFLTEEVILETYQALLNMSDEGTAVERTCSNFKTEICKYFELPNGCTRGDKCFFAHGREELQPMNVAKVQARAQTQARRVFVGGLPPSLDSDSLHKILERLFGLVEDAFVVSVQTRDDQSTSRGFGFVTFKNEKSAVQAIQAHYVTIMGKQVEIKSAVGKCISQAQLQKLSPRQQEQDQEQNIQQRAAREKNVDKMLMSKNSEKAESEKTSWLSRLVSGKPKAPIPEPEASRSLKSNNNPIWLKSFRKWFPSYLLEKHRKDGPYSLSSLKADFRTIFGLELDHASIGFTKLSDFMRTYNNICRMKEVSFGNGYANHLVLVPVVSKPSNKVLQPKMHCKPSAASLDGDTTDTDSSKCLQDHLPDPREVVSIKSNDSICHQDLSDPCEDVSIESSGPKCFQDLLEPLENVRIRSPSKKEANLYHDVLGSENVSALKEVLPVENPKVLQFSDPFLLFNTQPPPSKCYNGAEGTKAKAGTTEGKGMNQQEQLRHQNRHLVLETLARKRNSTSLFFLREFDFYENYKKSIMQGKCFWCNQPKLLWSNFPCQHRLWCTDCKLDAARAAGNFEHKCAVCDRVVERFIFIPTPRYTELVHGDAPSQKEFPPLTPSHIQMPSNSPSSPSIKEKNWKVQSEKAYSSSMWRTTCTN